jgi:predicted TIM-barrel fold metal-dependent hydrolase
MTPTGSFETEIVDVHCGWGATWAAPGWGDAEQVRTALRARGIRTAFLASELARRFDPARGNEQVAEATALGPDLRGWLVVHPARADEAHAQMRRYLYTDRFVGCALYPDPLGERPVTLRAVHDLLNAVRRFGKPILIAATSGEAMLHVAQIAQEMTTLKVIASGMGGLDWREAVDLAARPMNLYLDICGALTPQKLEYAIATLNGARKLLFASGAPHTDPAAVLGLLDDIDLSPDDRVRLLNGNATRLFSLGADQAAETDDLRPLDTSPPEATGGPGSV